MADAWLQEGFWPHSSSHRRQLAAHSGMTQQWIQSRGEAVPSVGTHSRLRARVVGAAELERLRQAEKEQGIVPDAYLAAFMKANTLEGKRESIHTEYLLHTMGLGVCADTQAGSIHDLQRLGQTCGRAVAHQRCGCSRCSAWLHAMLHGLGCRCGAVAACGGHAPLTWRGLL